MKKNVTAVVALALLAWSFASSAASEWNTQDYDLYPGDFNADGRTDMLFVAKSPDKGSGIALSDGAQLIAGHQVWNANGFGIPWHSGLYRPVLGDFNRDGRTDIFMQRQTPGDHYLLLANEDGTVSGISQTIPNVYAGYTWSGDQHRIISIEAFDSSLAPYPRGHRLFLQATAKGGTNAIIETNNANRITNTVVESWSDGYLGFKWNLTQAVVHTGDFNGDGNGELLVQAKPDIVLVDFDISIPIPVYRPQSFGVVYFETGPDTVIMWDRMRAGVDWSATQSNIVIGDFDGNGRDDIVVQPQRGGASVYVVRPHASNKTLLLDSPAVLTFSGAANAAGDSYRLLVANINGATGVDSTPGLYLQAASAAGTDLIANTIPTGGGSATTASQTQQYQSSPTPGTAVGKIDGSFSVEQGAAAYTVPIEMPPGIAGLKPELSLTYSSRAGNGPMGVGWTVAGLSSIARCSMTIDADGLTDGVDLDSKDAFCLDGSRLKASTGTNGQVGAEYRTEIESFQRVESVGGVANDPGSWIVREKSGLIRYYGASADSRIELQGKSAALIWAVTRIEDRYGNSINYQYSETNAQSSFVPTEISWGRGAPTLQNVVGRVHFEYWSTRADPTSGYLAGSIVGSSKLLRQIDVFSRQSATQSSANATTAVRSYYMNYETSPNSGLTHLKELVECDGGAGASKRCLGSTKMTWQHGASGFSVVETSTGMVGATTNLRPIDINGDGRTDYMWSYGTSNQFWAYKLSSITNTTSTTGLTSRSGPDRAIFIDYNSDGYQDVLQSTNYSAGGNMEWFPGAPTGLLSLVSTSIPNLGNSVGNLRTAVGDFDGDGTQDIAYAVRSIPSSNLTVHFNQPGGFAIQNASLPDGRNNIANGALGGVPLVSTGLGPWDQSNDGEVQAVQVINFDNDGRDDVLVRVGTGCTTGTRGLPPFIPTYQCSGQQYKVFSYDPVTQVLGMVWSQVVDGSNPEWSWTKTLDANGDGLTDVLYATSAGWVLRVGTGSAVEGLKAVWSASSYVGQILTSTWNEGAQSFEWVATNIALDATRLRYAQVLDFDRDGRVDVMFGAPDGSGFDYWTVLRNTGTSFATSADHIGIRAYSPQNAMVVDDRGDGIADLVFRTGSNASHDYYITYGRGPAAGVVERITDGFGASTQVQYAPLTEQNSSGVDVLYEGHTPFNIGGDQTAAVAFPNMDTLAPVIVVSQVAQDNGLGAVSEAVSSVRTAYKYAGLKTNRSGRGMLGFSRVTSQNVNTTIVTMTEYAQQWPYSGMTTRTEQRYPDVTTMTTQEVDIGLGYHETCDTNYFCVPLRVTLPLAVTTPGPRITETVNTLATLASMPSGRWFAYAQTSTEKIYPLQGAAVGTNAIKRIKTEYLNESGVAAGDRFDSYGNPYFIKVTVDNGAGLDAHVTTTKNQYSNDSGANWCIGRLTDSVVEHSKQLGLTGNPGAQSISRHASFTYRAAPYCDLDIEYVEPGTGLEQWTDHGYDSFGNRVSSTMGATGPGAPASRTTTADFSGTQGQFANQVVNAAGQSETLAWDPRFGVKLQSTGPNQLTSSIQYDSFGRTTANVLVAGLEMTKNARLYWCAQVGCMDSRSITVIHAETSDGGLVRSEFDRLNRETTRGTQAFDGRWLWTEKRYDPIGREYLTSQPFFDPNKKCWTFRRFDLLGRVTVSRDPYKTGQNSDGECTNATPSYTATDSELPGGSSGGRFTHVQHDLVDGALIGTKTVAYAGDAVAERTAVRWMNVMDRTRVVQDQTSAAACTTSSSSSATCLAVLYDHDAQGNVTMVRRTGEIAAGAGTSPTTIETTAAFNARGFKTALNDPDSGAWTYGYNAYGEVISQLDAKGQQTTFSYDTLGRKTSRTEQGEGTTNWYYDEVAIGGTHAIGKLTRVVGQGGAYEERSVYDDFGRLATTKRKIDGNWYRIDRSYDAQSRLDLLKYPSWVSSSNPDALPADADRVVLRHNYNALGYLASTQNAASGTVYWRADEVDQYGVTRETLGNGVEIRRTFEATTGFLRSIQAGIGASNAVQNMTMEFDRKGSLLRRADVNLSRSEDFTYDALDRLTQTRLFPNATWNGAPTSSETMYYDVFGNIRSKGAGYTAYNHVVNTTGALLCNAAANAVPQPHAVRQVTVGATTRTLCYDANGNVTKQLNGQYDAVTYWVSNLAKRISKGADYAEFDYAPEGMRYKQVASSGGATQTTLYVGGLYERLSKSGSTEHTYYIAGGTGVVALYKRTVQGAATTDIRYLHRDHLGTLVALSDAMGSVAAADRMSFDAWGKRRSNTWAASSPGTQISPSTYSSFTTRGFTGHEQLDLLGVVHMNGRVYDSELGRFLSADPVVQSPYSTQGFNRYTYVNNNPLSFTDPSGYVVNPLTLKAFFEVLLMMVGYAAQYYALMHIVAGAGGSSSQGNPLEQRISIGFGTGRTGRWGQPRTGVTGNESAPGDLASVLEPASDKVTRIMMQSTAAGADRSKGVSNETPNSVKHSVVSDAMLSILKVDTSKMSDAERLQVQQKVKNSAQKLRTYLAGLSKEDFLAVFMDRNSAKYKRFLKDHEILEMLRIKLDIDLRNLVVRATSGVIASRTNDVTEKVKDKATEAAVTTVLAGPTRTIKGVGMVWDMLQGANDQMQLQDQDLDLSTLEAGELGFNSIECNVDGANPGCEAMFDYVGPAPAN